MALGDVCYPAIMSAPPLATFGRLLPVAALLSRQAVIGRQPQRSW